MVEVGCAGILVEDTFCGPMNELPREGGLVAIDSMPTMVGGCAANVAIDLAKQGHQADVAGCVGDDPAGTFVVARLKSQGIGCARIARSGKYPTSKTVILLVEGQDRRYIHAFGANKAFTAGRLDRRWLAALKVFYLGGLFTMPGLLTEELLGLLRFCRENRVITVVDVIVQHAPPPLDDIDRILPFIDYFLPNDDEAGRLTGETDILPQLRALRSRGANTVIITRGRLGACAAHGDDFWCCDAYRTEPVDPSGAGDAFSAGLIVGLLKGWGMPRMLKYASALGASATHAIGTTEGVYRATEAETYVESHDLSITSGSIK